MTGKILIALGLVATCLTGCSYEPGTVGVICANVRSVAAHFDVNGNFIDECYMNEHRATVTVLTEVDDDYIVRYADPDWEAMRRGCPDGALLVISGPQMTCAAHLWERYQWETAEAAKHRQRLDEEFHRLNPSPSPAEKEMP